MSNLTIAVLRGGPSSEYEVSLKSGAAAINALSENESNTVLDILIDKEGAWHKNGMAMSAARALKSSDVAVIAMHGEYGEDGTVQRELEALGMPYIGSGADASALAMSKPRTHYSVDGLPMIKLPEHYVVREDDIESDADYETIAQDIFKRFGPPYIVKPANGGSSVGLRVAKSIAELPHAIESVAQVAMPVLVEQLVRGKETTCGVVEEYRDQEHYALPPIEVVPPDSKNGLYDYEAKYSDDDKIHARMICPANFTKKEKQQIEEASKAVHKALGLRHYSRSDFILSPHGLYFLEVNTLPGLTQESLLPKSLEVVGTSLREFLEHVIDLALSKK